MGAQAQWIRRALTVTGPPGASISTRHPSPSMVPLLLSRPERPLNDRAELALRLALLLLQAAR